MIAETFAQDLRIGLRVLAKDKSFCALSVFVLALGICAVTTMFTTVNATIIRGFSFPNSDRMTKDGIASMLFGVSALDPPTYVAVFALVTLISLFSVFVPAQRATRVRPMVALRAEQGAYS